MDFREGKSVAKFKKPLSETHPDIAAQWSDRNEVSPDEVGPGTVKPYWWVGSCGHEWQAPPNSRTNKRSGCPYCSRNGSKVLPGENDLATVRPDIAKDWHPTKNTVSASTLRPKSDVKVWWLGECGHEWLMRVASRTSGGQGCPVCASRRVIPGENDFKSRHPGLAMEWHPENDKAPEEVSWSSAYKAKWVCLKGHEFEVSVNQRSFRGSGCPSCAATSYVSRAEKELSDWVSAQVKTDTTYRQLKGVHEVDILCQDQMVAIEFNGLYWHSDSHKTRRYHYLKSKAVENHGYQLIHVWEDDWTYRRPVVEKMLKRKLGVSNETRLNARGLTYRQVSSSGANKFLEENHIQGASGGSWRGGLFHGEELVALMLMKRRSEGHYELTRFATSAIVRGGHSKLLKRFIEEAQPKSIVTFADRCVSDGGLYESCGFKRDGELAPDYMYRVGTRREHKFNYRKARFKNDPNLKYEEGLTERQLAELNGLERIYDAGKVRWVLTCE